MADGPAAPVFAAPPHLEHAGVLRVWFTEPIGVVTQIVHPVHADMEMARFFTDQMDPRLRELGGQPTPDFTFVHAWQHLSGYDTPCRRHLTDWGLGLRDHIRSLVVVLGDDTSSLARMGVNVAFSALRLAGIDARLASDIDEVVTRLELRPREP